MQINPTVKTLGIGFAGALAAIAIVALVYFAYDTHRMAVRGDAAAAFIERVNAQPPPAAPPTPREH